jgi:hypothetical protein
MIAVYLCFIDTFLERMKKLFGKIENKRDEESDKPHSSFIGKKFNVGRHTVIVEVRCMCRMNDTQLTPINLFLICHSRIGFFSS